MTPETLWTKRFFAKKKLRRQFPRNLFVFQHLIATWSNLKSPAVHWTRCESSNRRNDGACLIYRRLFMVHTVADKKRNFKFEIREAHISHEITCARSWFSCGLCPHRRKAENIIRGYSSRNAKTDKFWLIVLNGVNYESSQHESNFAERRTNCEASQFGGLWMTSIKR